MEPVQSLTSDPNNRRGVLDLVPVQERRITPLELASVDAGDSGAEGGILDYWRILRRHKGLILVVALFGAAVGFGLTLLQTPIYQARTSLEIQEINDSFFNMKQVNPVVSGEDTTDVSDIQTKIKLLQSEALAERVIAKLNQSFQGPIVEKGRWASWRKLLRLSQPNEATLRQQALAGAVGSVRVHAANSTRIVEVNCDSIDPRLAAAVANTLANEFIDQNLEARWKSAQHTGEWLTKQLEEMRIKLEHSEDQLQTYARTSGLMFTDEKSNISKEKLQQLQESLSAAQADRIAKESHYKMAQASPDALPDFLSDASLKDYQNQLTTLRRDEAQLSTTFTDNYPKIKRIQAQIKSVESAAAAARTAILKRVANEYQEAIQRERLLADDYERQRRQVTSEDEKTIHYNILKREVDSNRALYESILQRMKEASVVAAVQASNVRVVDPAKVPGAPYKPDVRQHLLMGLMTGALFGALLAIIQDRANRTIQQPGESPLYLGIPELGIIPAAENPSRLQLARRMGRSSADSNSKDVAISSTGGLEDRIELVTWSRKPSPVAESFRAALISILFSGQNGSRPQSIVMTSAGPAEGKSTVTSNLAIALAETNQRVLLIDADMRRPRQHHIFSVPNERGLSNLLRDKRPLADCEVADSIVETAVPGLSVLPSGSSINTATNLLYSNRMRELLTQMRGKFDMVLIDTPPMLQIPDARVLGRLTDSVILVVRAGHTTRDAAQAARQRFSEDGTGILGTILNDWDPNDSPNGYYGYHKGHYNSYYKGYRSYYGQPEKSA